MLVLVLGGSGFVGRFLVEELRCHGHQVHLVSRDPAGTSARVPSGVKVRGYPAPVDGYDAVVNLAGENIFGARWNAEVKETIRKSRVAATRQVVAQIAAARKPPRVLINGSAVGYYGDRGNEELPESAGPGTDFLARICQEWEAATVPSRRPADSGEKNTACRTVLLRTGVVLHPDGGALAQMLPPFRFGLGGPILPGSQWFAWIHVADLVGLIRWALEHEDVAGPLNAVAPGVVTNRDFTKQLGAVLRRPTVFPIPAFGLKLKMGEVAEVLTASQRCVPAVAQKSGYAYAFPQIEAALADLFA